MSIPIVRLERFADTPHGTFGNLFIQNGAFRAFSVERPWCGNQPGISCIPEGVYHMERGFYNRGGYAAWEVLRVLMRSEIKIHSANCASQLQGCIAVGLDLGWVKVPGADEPTWAITNSRKAFGQFMHALSGHTEAILDVRWNR